MRSTTPSVVLGLLALASPIPALSQSAHSGKAIDTSNFDRSVRPGDNFYLFVNGGWMKKNPIPPGYSRWGTFQVVEKQNSERIRAMLENAARSHPSRKGDPTQLLGDFYSSAMDTVAAEAQGSKPLKPYLELINDISSPDDLARVIGELHSSVAGQAAFLFYRDVDVSDPTRYIASFKQGGLGLPNRTYYLDSTSNGVIFREKYLDHIAKMLRLIGPYPARADSDARVVLGFETRLAKYSLSAERERDPKITFHKLTVADLQKLAPHFNWSAYIAGLGLSADLPVNVVTPDFFTGLSDMILQVPLSEWKTYLKWNLLTTNAEFLNSEIAREHFAFYGQTLNGESGMLPRWQFAQQQTEAALGWALGQEYVKANFSAPAKQRMLTMIGDIRNAFALRIRKLDWMSERTKVRALKKLEAITVNVGYPDVFPDMSKMEISRRNLLANVVSANRLAVQEEIKKLRTRVDKAEFGMTPQQVNAFYSAQENKIVFPAGILQPPFFNESFDDAVNYGAIGSVIAHEFTHAFDDQGSQYDPEGKLANWWDSTDARRFHEKQILMIDQYNAYTVLDGLHLNGELTVGENIADLGGVSISYDAFHQHQKTAGVARLIDGLTPDQRFFVGWAQLWRVNMTPEAIRLRVKTSTTSYAPFRVIGPLSNHPGFIAAFHLGLNDRMLRSPEQQITIW
jgi:putative endopeptidase